MSRRLTPVFHPESPTGKVVVGEALDDIVAHRHANIVRHALVSVARSGVAALE